MRDIIHTDNRGNVWRFSVPDGQADIIARFLYSVRNLADHEIAAALQTGGNVARLLDLQADIEAIVLSGLSGKY